MSSSTFIQQRWTSVNDLTTTTTNSNNNKQSTPFFLRPQLAPPPPPPPSLSSLSNLRPSQSLISLVESPSKNRCQSSKNRLISSRIANIIHQFESQSSELMNNSTKVSSPIRSVFVKQWEGTRKNGNSPRTPPIVVVETSSPIPFNLKKNNNNNNKPQPIIICERITNHNRPTPSPINPKIPLIKTWSQLKLMSQQQQILESDTDSAIHTMVSVINNDSIILSRSSTSGTTDSTCSSSCSSSSSSPPRFARPTIASTQKQRQFMSNSTSFKRTNSPPSSIMTFTRAVPPIVSNIVPLYAINEDLEQQQTQSPILNNCFCSSERISTPERILSDTNSITKNTNLPLRYKRDSFIRLYG